MAPVIALDVTTIKVNAEVKTGNALNAGGDVTIQAGSKRKNKATSSASAAGNKVAVGAAISIAVVNVDTIATSGREISGAENVTVSASSANSVEATAIAGANGAKAESGDDPAPAAEGEEDGEATKSLNKVLKAGNELSKGEKEGEEKAECPETTPQKAETSEGQVSVGAAMGLIVAGGKTEAYLNESVSCGGDLTVMTETEKDVKLTADASASPSIW